MFNFGRALASLLLILALLPAAAQEAPDALVRRISSEVLNAVKADQEIQRGNRARILQLVRSTILPHIDFERMTQTAMGRYWNQATPEQKQRVTEEFRALLVHVYSGALSQVSDQELVFRPMRGNPASGEVEVRSQVVRRRGAEPVELNYRLAREDAGWKIYDVSVLDVWLVQSYRSSFAREIRNNGIDGLIAALAQRNKRLAAGAAPATVPNGG